MQLVCRSITALFELVGDGILAKVRSALRVSSPEAQATAGVPVAGARARAVRGDRGRVASGRSARSECHRAAHRRSHLQPRGQPSRRSQMLPHWFVVGADGADDPLAHQDGSAHN